MNKNTLVIEGWMTINFGLKGNDLLVYAYINSLEKNTREEVFISKDYIKEFLQISDDELALSLQNLQEKNIITFISRNYYTNNKTMVNLKLKNF